MRAEEPFAGHDDYDFGLVTCLRSYSLMMYVSPCIRLPYPSFPLFCTK